MEEVGGGKEIQALKLPSKMADSWQNKSKMVKLSKIMVNNFIKK